MEIAADSSQNIVMLIIINIIHFQISDIMCPGM